MHRLVSFAVVFLSHFITFDSKLMGNLINEHLYWCHQVRRCDRVELLGNFVKEVADVSLMRCRIIQKDLQHQREGVPGLLSA